MDDHEKLLLEKGMGVVTGAEDSHGEPMVRVDGRLFAKVISNLVSNACHYSPFGEEIRIAKASDVVQFSIENTGVHIPEKENRDCLDRLQEGTSRETGRQEEAVWVFLLFGWYWSCITFLIIWKIQTIA